MLGIHETKIGVGCATHWLLLMCPEKGCFCRHAQLWPSLLLGRKEAAGRKRSTVAFVLVLVLVLLCCRCVKHLWAPKRRFYWGSSGRAHRKNCYKRACIIHHVEVTPLRIRNNHTPRRTQQQVQQQQKKVNPQSCFCLPSEGYLTNCRRGGLVSVCGGGVRLRWFI